MLGSDKCGFGQLYSSSRNMNNSKVIQTRKRKLSEDSYTENNNLCVQAKAEKIDKLRVLEPINKNISDSSTESNLVKPKYMEMEEKQIDIYPLEVKKIDMFSQLSDEVVLKIFKYLPKRSLYNCALVCAHWKRICYDETLWTRIDLSGRKILTDTLAYVIIRNPYILRMAFVEIVTPMLKEMTECVENLRLKLEYLDISGALIRKEDLANLLGKCKRLKKLSIEHCPADENVCKSISQNVQLETLNMSQCYEVVQEGMKCIVEKCVNLKELNVAWTGLSTSAITMICTLINPKIERLNMAGCGRKMFDENVEQIVSRCEDLIELDLSDNINLSCKSVEALLKSNITSLSLSRCYRILVENYKTFLQKPRVLHLNIFGVLPDEAINSLKESYQRTDINKQRFSTIARPTVGIRRTSVWGLRVRD